MEEEKLKAGEREFQNEEVTVPRAAKTSAKRKKKQSSQQIVSLPTGGFCFTVIPSLGVFAVL